MRLNVGEEQDALRLDEKAAVSARVPGQVHDADRGAAQVEHVTFLECDCIWACHVVEPIDDLPAPRVGQGTLVAENGHEPFD